MKEVQAAKDVNTVVARLSNMGAGKSGGKEDPETAEKLKKLEKTERELADLKKEVEDLRKRRPRPPAVASRRRWSHHRRRSAAASRRRRSRRRRSRAVSAPPPLAPRAGRRRPRAAAARTAAPPRRPGAAGALAPPPLPAAWRRRRSRVARAAVDARAGAAAAADPGRERRRRRPSRAGRRRRAAPPGAPGAPPPPMAMAPAYKKKEARKPGVQMRQLHWGKLPDTKIKGTMWENEVGDEGAFKKIDVAELESMFAASGAPQKKEEEDDGGDRDSGAGPKQPCSEADDRDARRPGRRRTTSGSRSRASEVGGRDRVSITDGCGDGVHLRPALVAAGDPAERGGRRDGEGYEGDVAMLGKTEQFFLAIAGVPRFQIRTRCMLIRATFPEKEAELKEKLKAVSAAADEVRTSMCLKVVLEYALALGNYLNGTSNKGAAWGFKLETLNKLQGAKSTDNKTTLLHYLARLYEAEAAKASDPESFSLAATMPNLEMAARTVWKDDGAELAQRRRRSSGWRRR